MGRWINSLASSTARRRSWTFPLVVLLAALGATAGSAQEITWRYDYNQARREAIEKNRPLLIDFGTDRCFWCVKLDTTTFRDPTIMVLVNEQFVPLRINAQQNPWLTDKLFIRSFPTVILASPEGKILGSIEGYVDVPRFQDHVQRALSGLNNPEWMTRDYQAAAKAIAESDYSRAMALLKGIVEDGKNRPVQVKAQQLLQDLEQQGVNRLARAKQLLDKGQTPQALETVTDLLKSFPGTQAAAEAGEMLKRITHDPDVKTKQRVQRARELLAQAREDYRTQQYLCCIERCEVLANNYPDLTEGIEAIQLANEIKNNPEWMRQVCETLSDRLGMYYLALAETWLKKGQPQQAVLCLERVIQTLPGTRQAETAQARLDQINGQPTRHAGFKRQ